MVTRPLPDAYSVVVGRSNGAYNNVCYIKLYYLVANEQPLRAPGANWARYYARFFIALYK